MELNIMKKAKKFIYIINYPTFEEELCMLEMRSIFDNEPQDKVLISNISGDIFMLFINIFFIIPF